MTPDTKAPQSYQPRFDFGRNLDPSGQEFATLGDLLDELNYETTYRPDGQRADNSCAGAIDIGEKNLKLTLDFIRDALGEDIRGTTDLLPLSTIKTIKLLYTKNDSSDTQLYRRLARPDECSATMEHWEPRNSTRNEKTIRIAAEIMTAIGPELDVARSRRIETSLLETSKLLKCIALEDQQILKPIYDRFNGNDEELIDALTYMTQVVASYVPLQRRTAPAAPLHEKLYIYLRTLPFFHFIGEYKRHIEAEEAMDPPIHPILDQVEAFCDALSPTMGFRVDEKTPVTSIAQFPAFLSCHALALSKLIHCATGIKSERRDLLAIGDETLKLLHAYVFHQWERTHPEVVNLTVTDCVAALTAIRIQQKSKKRTNYTPQWVGQDSTEMTTSRLLAHLDSTRSIEDLYEEDYIPQGALHILYHRFCIVFAKILGHHQRQRARMEFQLARQTKYAECFTQSDIDCIDQGAGRLLALCMHSAYGASISDKLQTV